jgi:hypothetical protein
LQFKFLDEQNKRIKAEERVKILKEYGEKMKV